jgi:hypothetical protein
VAAQFEADDARKKEQGEPEILEAHWVRMLKETPICKSV